MNVTFRTPKLIAALLLAALSAASLPISALADDETPPAPTETATPTTEAGTVTGEPIEPTQVATVVPVEEVVVNEQQVVAESTATELPIIDIQEPLSEFPGDTGLVVVGEDGQALPLGSSEAAKAISTGDPMWCPVGVTPIENVGGCTESFTSLDALFSNLTVNPKSVAGVIWIETGYSDTVPAELDGSDVSLTTMRNLSLTIKGGWTGSGSTINTSTPSTLNHYLHILNWNADITLSDIIITGVPSSGDFALDVQTTGKITLTRVGVIDNAGPGTNLDNSSGAAKDVVITSGPNIFSGNGGDGLTINTIGKITLSYVVANGNAGYGAVLSNDGASSDLAVTLTGINEFKFNEGGLLINSRGAIALKNIYANYNTLYEGATIDNSDSTTGAGVTLTGINQFNNNGSHGLEIISKGVIAVNKLSAASNGFAFGALTSFGAHLDNSGAGSLKAVTLSTSNNISDNADYGLLVVSKGAVTIALLFTDRNGGNGAEIDNLASSSAAPQNVTFTGAGSFTENNGVGLTINTYGTVLLGGVTANDNNLDGTLINNSTGLGTLPKAVTLNGNNNFINNGGFGVQINSLGAITLNSVFADENFSFGASFNNSTATTAAAVMIKGISEFLTNGGYGLHIQSKGNITVYNFDSDYNGGYGAWFENDVAGSVGNVSVITTISNWCNTVYENNGRGLLVESYGSVNLSYICSDANLGEGVRVDNSQATSPKPVIFTGTYNSHNDNDETGLVVLSRGSITMNNLYASGNGWNDGIGAQDGLGAYLNNRFGGTGSMQNVTITGRASFYDSFYSGLEIYSYGAISLSNVTADNNGYGEENDLDKRGYGLYLDNQTLGAAGPKTISLKGSNTLTGNWDGGVQILGSGAIALSNIEASNNNGFGVDVTNDYSGAPLVFRGGLTITGSGLFESNGSQGITAKMWGTITVANLSVYSNGSYGAYLRAFIGNVSLTGSNDFSVNEGFGLSVEAPGNISAAIDYVSGNHGFGASLVNDYWIEPQGVFGSGTTKLSGVLRFGYNWEDGLIVTSNKALSFSNLDVYGNGGNGATLYSGVSVTLSGNNTWGSNIFDGNGQVGVEIIAPASVTLTNITAINNGWEGVYVDITTGWVPKAFYLKGTNTFNNNGWDGLSVQTYGIIYVNNITANGNGGSGAYLDNFVTGDSEITSNLTVTGINFFNDNSGPYAALDMYSHGNILVNNITANGNLGGGAMAWNFSNGISTVKVTFSGINTFNDNGLDITSDAGLEVHTDGAITLNNITAINNLAGGVILNNQAWDYYGVNPAISIMGINEFSGNGLNGIYALGGGSISISRVIAESNGQTGVSLDAQGKVNISCASLNFNDDRGWQIVTSSILTLKGVITLGNVDGEGLLIGGGTLVVDRSCTLS